MAAVVTVLIAVGFLLLLGLSSTPDAPASAVA
jgi:hypothetical protein